MILFYLDYVGCKGKHCGKIKIDINCFISTMWDVK